jgi:hypothetical protein
MYFVIEKNHKVENELNRIGKIYSEVLPSWQEEFWTIHDLPAIHVWEDGFTSGDASSEDLIPLIDKKIVTYDDEDGYNFLKLDEIYCEFLDAKIEKLKNSKWIYKLGFKDFEDYQEHLEEKLQAFLNENYYESSGVIGHDYSLCIDIEDDEIFEKIHASSNWVENEGWENSLIIFHLNNYDKAYLGFSDYLGESGFDIFNYLNLDSPFSKDDWEELSFQEKVDFFEENHPKIIADYNDSARDNEIEDIINEKINWDEIEEFVTKDLK